MTWLLGFRRLGLRYGLSRIAARFTLPGDCTRLRFSSMHRYMGQYDRAPAAPPAPWNTGQPAGTGVPPAPAVPSPARAEYRVLTQKDRMFSGKFDPEKLQTVLNSLAVEGWRVIAVTSASFPGFASHRDEVVVILERLWP